MSNRLLTKKEVSKGITNDLKKVTKNMSKKQKKEFMEALSKCFFNMKYK